MLCRSGFEMVRSTYFNSISYLPAWLLAQYDRFRGVPQTDAPLGELAVPPAPINQGMKLMMSCERVAIRLLGRVPLGVTAMVVARRSDKSAKTSRRTNNSALEAANH